ncbi:ELAC2, putative [Eimeria acervulina]|uniref:ribonuclease Z n=1 Tax=Eimeria acervulina TaxID=5801 RepID=U6GAM0_EIMAC|nr:ELAC2, putative [Eimeria acervulina]CDI76547.1 ELAC2, putative [Eimeria acervulina]
MSITAQLLGCHRLSVPPSIHIFCEGPRLLINAGENVQRYHLEKKLHIHRISDIFLTSLSPSSAAGLVGLLLSIEGTGATSVTLWGPHGLKPLLQLAIRSFAGLKNLEINYRLMGPPEAPPSLLGERFCTGGVCNGGCRQKSSSSSSSSSNSSSTSSSSSNSSCSSKGPRTCACSYGPSVKGTASGVPIEAFYLPHSRRLQQQQQQQQQQNGVNPLLEDENTTSSNNSSAANSSSTINGSSSSSVAPATPSNVKSAAAAAAATAAAAHLEPATADDDLNTKRRKLEQDGEENGGASAAAAAAAAAAGPCSSRISAAKAALYGDYGDTSDCLLLLLRCPTVRGRFFPEKAKALGD